MSAYICENKTYDRIYSGLLNWDRIMQGSGEYPLTEFKQGKTIDDKLNQLYILNQSAVNQRYDNIEYTKDYPKYKYIPDINIYQFLKSIRCLLYQLCEGDIPKTKEYQKLEKLCDVIAYEIVSRVPEYDSADWG